MVTIKLSEETCHSCSPSRDTPFFYSPHGGGGLGLFGPVRIPGRFSWPARASSPWPTRAIGSGRRVQVGRQPRLEISLAGVFNCEPPPVAGQAHAFGVASLNLVAPKARSSRQQRDLEPGTAVRKYISEQPLIRPHPKRSFAVVFLCHQR